MVKLAVFYKRGAELEALTSSFLVMYQNQMMRTLDDVEAGIVVFIIYGYIVRIN